MEFQKGIVDEAKENNVDLIITCDNGISAFEVVDYCNEIGIPINYRSSSSCFRV